MAAYCCACVLITMSKSLLKHSVLLLHIAMRVRNTHAQQYAAITVNTPTTTCVLQSIL